MFRGEKQAENTGNSLFFKALEKFHVIIHPGMQVEWNGERFRKWAVRIGPSVGKVIDGIASVDSSTGTVKGNKVGSCKITAKATDGSERFATITVFVEPEIPLDAVKFTKQGYFGLYNEFAVTFKNVTKTRTVKYVQFDVKYKYLGSEYTLDACYFNANLRPGQKKKEGWWDQIGIRLMYASDFRIYLTRVKYSDGTSDSFYNNNLIGWFF